MQNQEKVQGDIEIDGPIAINEYSNENAMGNPIAGAWRSPLSSWCFGTNSAKWSKRIGNHQVL